MHLSEQMEISLHASKSAPTFLGSLLDEEKYRTKEYLYNELYSQVSIEKVSLLSQAPANGLLT